MHLIVENLPGWLYQEQQLLLFPSISELMVRSTLKEVTLEMACCRPRKLHVFLFSGPNELLEVFLLAPIRFPQYREGCVVVIIPTNSAHSQHFH